LFMTGQESPENFNSPIHPGEEKEEAGLIVIQMNNPKAWYDRAGSLYKLGRYQEALDSYDQALALDQEYADAWNNRGMTLKCLGRHEEAVTSYERAIALDADFYQGWNNLGNALVELERYEEAVKSYQQAIAISPDYSQGWHNQGEALAALARYEEAIACYDRVLALKPTWRETKRLRQTALAKLQEQSPRPNPPVPEHRETPNPEEIIPEPPSTPPVPPMDNPKLAACDRMVERYPEDPEAWVDRGHALAEVEFYDEALSSYDRAIALDPEHGQAWTSRGITLKQLGRSEEALISYERALALQPPTPTPSEPVDTQANPVMDPLTEAPVASTLPEPVPPLTPTKRRLSPWGRLLRWIRQQMRRLWQRLRQWLG
jgi:tetratricopeptide (TPR) repeat protein